MGWPETASLGWTDPVDGPAVVAIRGGQLASPTSAQAAIDWDRYADLSPAAFVLTAHRQGTLPYVPFYLLRLLGRSSQAVDANVNEIRQTLVNPRLMRVYWQDVHGYLRSLGSTDLPVAIGVEQSVWALLEQQLGFTGENPHTPAGKSLVCPRVDRGRVGVVVADLAEETEREAVRSGSRPARQRGRWYRLRSEKCWSASTNRHEVECEC